MTNKREYPRDMSFVDRRGNAVHPCRESIKARKPLGKAYAFYDCDVSIEKIANAMPLLRRNAQTPKGLQVILREGTDGLPLNEALAGAINAPWDYRVMTHEMKVRGYRQERRPLSGMKYSLEASCEGKSNERVADEVRDIVYNIFQEFPSNSGVFRVGVLYAEEDGEYALKE